MLSRATLRDWGLSLLWLVLFATPVVFSAATTEAFEYPKIALLKAAALLFLAGGAVALQGNPLRLLRSAALEPIALGMLLSLLAAALSTLFSISPRTSLVGAQGSFAGLLTATAFVILFFAARGLCADEASARTALTGALAGVGVSIAYGLAQLGGFDPLRWRAPVVFSGVARVFSTQGHPNSLAQLLAVALPIALYFLLRAFQQRRRDRQAGSAFVVLGASALVLLTLSRAGVLALAAALLVLCAGSVVLLPTGRRRLALLGLLALLPLGIVLAALPEEGSQGLEALWRRLVGTGAGAVAPDPRRHLWAGAWSAFLEHPLLGAGLDCFSLVFTPLRTAEAWRSEWGQTPLKAHNQPLELLATRGLLGAAAALVLAFGALRALLRSLRRTYADRFLALACFAGLTAFAVHNLFHFPTAAASLLALTLVAILSRLSRPQASAPVLAQPAAIPGARALTVAALLAAALALGVLRPLRADVLCRAGTDATHADPALAVAYAGRAVELDGSRALLWQRLSAASQAAGRAEREPALRRQLFLGARHAALEALAREPSAYAYAHLGTVLSDLERELPPLASRPEVEQAFERARERDPANSFVHTAAAGAALATADLESAARWSALCLRLYPEFGPPRALLGATRLAAGRQLLAAGEKQRAGDELQRAVLLLSEAHAAEWRGDHAARAAAKVDRLAAMSALAALGSP